MDSLEQFIDFMLQYIPFWSVPLLMISVQFGYVFWLKMKRLGAFAFLALGSFSIISLIYYLWAGSPMHSVNRLKDFINNL